MIGHLRRVRVPAPRDLLSITLTGPVEPGPANSADGARRKLDLVFQVASADEVSLADEGGGWWSCPCASSGRSIRAHLWLADDTGGRRSLEAIKARLEAALFLVQAVGKRHSPAAILRGETPLHARLGAAMMGTQAGGHSVRFEIGVPLDTVEVEPRWRWPVQTCPRCRHEGHPLEIIDGKPTPEASLAIALGEAVFGGGCDPEDWTDFDAECAACGRGFNPLGTTQRIV